MKVLLFFLLAVVCLSCNNFSESNEQVIYNEALGLYRAQEYDKALSKLSLVLNDQVERNPTELIAKMLYLRGFIYYLQDKSKLAYADYLDAIEIAGLIGNGKLTSRLNNEIGQIFYENELFEQSLAHFKSALDQADEATVQDRAYYLFGIGKSLRRLNKLDEGLDHLLQAIDLNEQLRNHTALADDYIEIGKLQRTAGNFQSAIENYKQSMELSAFTRNPNYYLWLCNNNIGNVYLDMEKFETAESYLLESLKYKANESQLWVTYNNLGKVYNAKKDYAQAWECFKKSLKYNSKKGEMNELVITNHALKHTFQSLNQPDSLLYYTMMINDMALPIMETKSWLKDEEQKIALLTKYQDHINQMAEKEQYARSSWMMAFIMAFIVVSSLLSIRLWKIFNYTSPVKAHNLIKNPHEMIYLLDMFKKEKDELKKVMNQMDK